MPPQTAISTQPITTRNVESLKHSVDILLATYNGEKYLSDQLDSLLEQSYKNYRLLVRDDGSTDSTKEILNSYNERFGGRMEIIPSPTPSRSACANFLTLLSHSTADYILFCDQDDVWLPQKISKTITAINEIELKVGANTPIFWFSDATPVNGFLQPTAESYWASRKIRPEATVTLRKSLISGIANGCMAGINRALKTTALPVDANSIIGHDWYLVQLASLIGHVGWSPERLMYYRQHTQNVSGASHKTGFRAYISNAEKSARVKRGLAKRRMQAATILRLHGHMFDPTSRGLIEKFIAIESQGPLSRRLSIIRGRFLYDDLPRNLGMLLFC